VLTEASDAAMHGYLIKLVSEHGNFVEPLLLLCTRDGLSLETYASPGIVEGESRKRLRAWDESVARNAVSLFAYINVAFMNITVSRA